jgi:signal transduction histidine kinase
MKNIIEDILNGQDGINLLTDKHDPLANLMYKTNELIASYRQQKQNYEKERLTKKKLLSDLSHDVRTPLVSVIGYLEAVVQNRVDENNKEDYIETALHKAFVLKEQVNQLFEFVQSDANEIKFYLERIDICELLRQIMIDFLPIIEKDSINFEAKIPDNELYIFADKSAMTRIYQNLIRNSLIHGKGGNYLGIFLTAADDTIMVDITDKGCGIDIKHLPYVFDRLYKTDDARTSGGGLGLAVAKEFAEKMNGTIEVMRSVPGDTIFRVTFPIVK